MTEGPSWLAEAETAADKLGGSGWAEPPPGNLSCEPPPVVRQIIKENLPLADEIQLRLFYIRLRPVVLGVL